MAQFNRSIRPKTSMNSSSQRRKHPNHGGNEAVGEIALDSPSSNQGMVSDTDSWDQVFFTDTSHAQTPIQNYENLDNRFSMLDLAHRMSSPREPKADEQSWSSGYPNDLRSGDDRSLSDHTQSAPDIVQQKFRVLMARNMLEKFTAQARQFESTKSRFIGCLEQLLPTTIENTAAGFQRDLVVSLWKTTLSQGREMSKMLTELLELETNMSNPSGHLIDANITVSGVKEEESLSKENTSGLIQANTTNILPSSQPVPLEHLFWDKLGDANLAKERLYNLEADYKRTKMIRQSQKEDDIEPETPDDELFGEYLDRKREIVQEFSDLKVAAIHLYKLCIQNNVSIQKFDVSQLDIRFEGPSFARNVTLEDQHFNSFEAILEPAQNVSSLKIPTRYEPINLDAWKFTAALHQNISQYWRSGDEILNEQSTTPEPHTSLKPKTSQGRDPRLPPPISFWETEKARQQFPAEIVRRRYSDPAPQSNISTSKPEMTRKPSRQSIATENVLYVDGYDPY